MSHYDDEMEKLLGRRKEEVQSDILIGIFITIILLMIVKIGDLDSDSTIVVFIFFFFVEGIITWHKAKVHQYLIHHIRVKYGLEEKIDEQ
jgi:hypothetical protein